MGTKQLHLQGLPNQTALASQVEPLSSKKYGVGRIACGDVVTTLQTLHPDTFFDVVIADPPYNIGKDFGITSDDLPMPKYVDWTLDWLDICLKRLTPNGVLYLYGFPEILAHIAVKLPIERQHWIVWHYTNKTVPTSAFWQRSYETILCLWTSAKRPSLEVDQIREPYTDNYKRSIGRRRAPTESRYGGKNGKPTVYNGHVNGALPRDVVKVPALAGGAGAKERWFLCNTCNRGVFPPTELEAHRGHEVLKHPTQKPMELTKKLLHSRINNQDGSVLIPFAGSGSECVVAQELDINFLGIEINPHYVHLAISWLTAEASTAQL